MLSFKSHGISELGIKWKIDIYLIKIIRTHYWYINNFTETQFEIHNIKINLVQGEFLFVKANNILCLDNSFFKLWIQTMNINNIRKYMK